MNRIELDEYIASLDIVQILELMKRLVFELYERYMSEAK